jgi:hypothetical protein
MVAAKFSQHFTVDEANALIPFILSIWERVQALRSEMVAYQEDFERVHQAAPGNGGTETGTKLVEYSEGIGRLLKELDQKGVLVKDIENGLMDFPHIRENREVLLCWKVGEKSVSYWHEIDAGFRNRQPL